MTQYIIFTVLSLFGVGVFLYSGYRAGRNKERIQHDASTIKTLSNEITQVTNIATRLDELSARAQDFSDSVNAIYDEINKASGVPPRIQSGASAAAQLLYLARQRQSKNKASPPDAA